MIFRNLPLTNNSTTFHIDLAQLKRNWRWLDAKTHRYCRTASVVKANAYGHGMQAIVTSLFDAGCRVFCVARLEEAIELRSILAIENNAYEAAEIICFDGLQDGKLADYRSLNLIPALKKVSEIEEANKFARKSGKVLPVWVQLDTGMNRLGISKTELFSLFAGNNSVSFSGLDIRAIMSHLSSSDNPSHSTNEQHHARFIEMSKLFGALPRSLSASHGILLSDKFHFDITRPGIALYGYNDNPVVEFGCKPILKWTAPILQIRSISSGEQIGYGADFTARTPMRIATIGAGYADGYQRSLQTIGKISFAGYICNIVGRISMDSLVIDVSEIPDTVLAKTSQVWLLGAHYTASEMASDLSTISYEILTSLGTRPKRIYKK